MPKEDGVFYCPICVRFFVGKEAPTCGNQEVHKLVEVKDPEFSKKIVKDFEKANVSI